MFLAAALLRSSSRLQGVYLCEPAQISLGLAILSGEECLNEIPRYRRSNGAAAHAKDVHVVVFDTLTGRKVIVNEGCMNPTNFVGADGSANAASANGYPALHLAGRYGLSERDYEIRIIVAGIQLPRAEVNDVMTCRSQLRAQILL
jgi:hypothetical protein